MLTRRAIPVSERSRYARRASITEITQKSRDTIAASTEEIAKVITSPALDDGGKLNPARGLPGGSGISTKPKKPKKKPKDEELKHPPILGVTKGEDEGETVAKSFFVPILKAVKDKQTITGVVLQPEITDGQGDIMSADVIEEAAETFLSQFNKATKLGLLHKDFKKNFELLQSFTAPHDLVIGGKTVKQGSWIIKVRVISASIWKQVKDGKLTGFSIGGKARFVKVAQ